MRGLVVDGCRPVDGHEFPRGHGVRGITPLPFRGLGRRMLSPHPQHIDIVLDPITADEDDLLVPGLTRACDDCSGRKAHRRGRLAAVDGREARSAIGATEFPDHDERDALEGLTYGVGMERVG